ncbi:hypothetical protein [Marivirga harenae]|uniref:hypothetical protein n=1 Tax=Marivirga harenae TaxID=2010992 RepID=UPI0026E02149|nr:hypothetical protein [Marivirga harenae]WKV10875.1 hypothetical protein Q3Y49_11695 [Marivirga harenae]|tara:strand:+ start:158271 stop:159344 length:1074 start_codon:yes stop_codon:yes gene_type:complete
MSLPKYFSNPYFHPQHQLLHQKLSPVLKMLSGLTQAPQSFLALWDEDYQQQYNLETETYVQLNIDFKLFKSRFSKLNPEVIYVPNVRYHTLFQNIDFFKSFVDEEQLLIYPLVDGHQHAKGIVGVILPKSENLAFDFLFKQMESVGSYINQLFQDYLDHQKSSLLNHINLEDLPSSFFEAEINQKQELVFSNFSKTLMRKHPTFAIECSAEKRMSELLSMTLADFYALINKIKDKQNMEYVYSCSNQEGVKKYFLIKLHISEISSKGYRFLGVLEDFTVQKAYSSVLDQMIFDISHVMRRPVVTMKGLTNLIDMDIFDKQELTEITRKIKTVSEEMEEYIGAMFKIYEAKQDAIYHL